MVFGIMNSTSANPSSFLVY